MGKQILQSSTALLFRWVGLLLLDTCVQSCAGCAPAQLNAPVLAHKPTSSQGVFGKASHAELLLNVITRSAES